MTLISRRSEERSRAMKERELVVGLMNSLYGPSKNSLHNGNLEDNGSIYCTLSETIPSTFKLLRFFGCVSHKDVVSVERTCMGEVGLRVYDPKYESLALAFATSYKSKTAKGVAFIDIQD